MGLFFRSARCVIILWALALLVCGWAWTGILAQPSQGTVRGEITDPSAALVPGALVTLHSDQLDVTRTEHSDWHGSFEFDGIEIGSYQLTVTAKGFRNDRRTLKIKGGDKLTVSIRLRIEVQHEQVSVSSEELNSSPDRNLGAVILRGSDLDALATNAQDLKQQIAAMVGSDVTPQFYVDGFTANHLPPKSSIQEIRMNQDPYSAQYDTPGEERIEIITKPGSEKLHGSLVLLGDGSELNSQNPYVEYQPPYSSFYSEGNI